MYSLKQTQPDVEIGRQLAKLKKHIDALLLPKGLFERLFLWWTLSHWGNQHYYEVAEYQEGRFAPNASK